MKLSKREKILLGTFVLLVVSAALVGLWILPQWHLMQLNLQTLSNLEKQFDEANQAIAQMAEHEQQTRELQEQSQELYDLFEQTQGYDLSLMLSDMLERRDLTAVSLNISAYSKAPVPEQDKTVSLSSSSSESSEGDTQSQADSLPDFSLQRQANLSFSGGRANAYLFLDEISSYNPSIIVDGFTIETISEQEIFSIQLTLYEFIAPERMIEQAGASSIPIEEVERIGG